jgi:hypothetical protein
MPGEFAWAPLGLCLSALHWQVYEVLRIGILEGPTIFRKHGQQG